MIEENPNTALTRDRVSIGRFVRAFYSEIRKHSVLGPIFEEKVGDHWEEHFETLTDFWMNVLLGARTFKGNPFGVHRQVTALKEEHFAMWLGIFHPVAKRMLEPDMAVAASEKAERIASSLKNGLFFRI
ncbi:group III truncated hemoglobin [Kordiimonas sp. SCSIO 12603]|uniref:group III truncated hemoglobin n=1 Tax=Kordiimonas sp. SCSIO 12603 TaxID=2829596 RepID=UPI002107B3EC|nr:group III truncated hemoglobin [Kordiimonas sp. SCSIO 12603]UTW58652.1 group III truncated hemoglobin [Kordiimonas sp. SCSIO 12603]